MAVFWFAVLGLGMSMSGTAIWLARRDRRRALDERDEPEQHGRHSG
ncbi:hypothetical protein [Actinoplanes awajinensis]|nr:hypothetical protein [Actinoplanes awajinensis]